MKSKSELKEIGIKNRLCYYFDDNKKNTKIKSNNILLNKKLYENISAYIISYQSQQVQKYCVLGSIK